MSISGKKIIINQVFHSVAYHWLTILYPRPRFTTRVMCITPARASTLAAAITAMRAFVTRGFHPGDKT